MDDALYRGPVRFGYGCEGGVSRANLGSAGTDNSLIKSHQEWAGTIPAPLGHDTTVVSWWRFSIETNGGQGTQSIRKEIICPRKPWTRWIAQRIKISYPAASVSKLRQQRPKKRHRLCRSEITNGTRIRNRRVTWWTPARPRRDRNRARRIKVPSMVPTAFPYYRPRPQGPCLSLGWLQRGCHMTGGR
jgi:hypothetical protein